MSQKTIGLRLQLNGVTQTITSIKDLEKELELAKQDLKELEIGSENFNKLANEIGNAETQLKKLNGEAKKGDFAKSVENLGKLTSGVTSGFAAASAAAQLFGKDTKGIAESAAKAQNLLTIAITARTAAEALSKKGIIATTVATVAQTVATNGAIASLRILWATMLANPITAILAGIGLLVAALITFASASDKAAISQEQLGKELEKNNQLIKDTNSLLSKYDKSISDTTQRLQLQGATLQEIFETTQRLRQQQIDAARERLIQLNNEISKLEELGVKEEELKEIKEARIELANKYADLINQQQLDELKNAERLLEVERTNQRRRNELITSVLQKRLADLRFAYQQERKLAEKNGEDVLLVDKKYAQERSKIIKESQKELEKLTQQVNKELLDVEGRSFKQRKELIIKDEEDRRKSITDNLNELKKSGVATQKEIDDANQAIEDSLKLQNKKIELLQNDINKKYLEGQSQLFKNSKELQTEFFGDLEQLEEDRTLLFIINFEEYKKIELEKIKLLLESADVEKQSIDETLKKYEDYFDKLGLLQFNNQQVKEGFLNIDKQLAQDTIDLENKTNEYILNAQKLLVNDEKGLLAVRELIEKEHQRQLLQIQVAAIKAKIQTLEQDPTVNPEELKRLKAELLKIEIQYNDKVKEIAKSTSDFNKENFKKNLDTIGQYITEFSNIINQLASLSAQSFSFQLERLEFQYKNTMDSIVGDTEEANAKRVEAEKIYQNQKKKIEREAQLSSLRFTLAQTIASGAQAVVNALANIPPPANAIVAGIQGVISAAQIALVSNQLNFIKSQPLARGGFVRGRSHEQGGVKYQGGGVELEGNEAVINRRSTLQYSGLLSQINESGGGRPLLVNNIMDSRLAEVLASVKSEPIRAYVLEQDITKSQAVNRRLEELATF
jgi:hypothetical protein